MSQPSVNTKRGLTLSFASLALSLPLAKVDAHLYGLLINSGISLCRVSLAAVCILLYQVTSTPLGNRYSTYVTLPCMYVCRSPQLIAIPLTHMDISMSITLGGALNSFKQVLMQVG